MAIHPLKVAALGAILLSTGALARTPDSLGDLVGAKAAGGETQLQARGYAYVTTNTAGGSKWAYWYNERDRQCVQVATTNGRYSVINTVPDANCRASAGASSSRPDRDWRDDRSNGDSLTLICYGSGSGPAAQSYSGYSYNPHRKRFEPNYGTTLGSESFSSDVQVEIRDGLGRIHLGNKLVSPIHSGGTDGWWPIDQLMVTRDRITGRYRLNGMNKPQLDINRRTGTIRIKAATSFTGRCDAGDWRSERF